MFSKVRSLGSHRGGVEFAASRRFFACSSGPCFFSNKTALITGSTSGIGLCVAESLASKGCKVAITGLGDVDGALNKVKAAAKDSNRDSIHFIAADLCKKEDSVNLIKNAVDIFGDNRLDILVNNAGLQHVSSIENFDEDKYYQIIEIMLNSPFFMIQTVLPIMRSNGYGRIINIASAHSLRGSAFKSAYVAAKHGVLGLTKSCGLEMALESDIDWTCNSICPGYVRTELATSQVHTKSAASGKSYEEEEHSLLSEKIPNARWTEPSNIAAMVRFLCTEDARQINGSAWSIDGGWTAR